MATVTTQFSKGGRAYFLLNSEAKSAEVTSVKVSNAGEENQIEVIAMILDDEPYTRNITQLPTFSSKQSLIEYISSQIQDKENP